MGIPCNFIVEDRKTERFKRRVENWALAAKTAMALRTMKIGAIGGRLSGMGDILMDDASFMRKVGPEIIHEYAGNIYNLISKLTPEEIEAQYRKDYEIFDIDPNLSEEAHKEAIKIYLGTKKLCNILQVEYYEIG